VIIEEFNSFYWNYLMRHLYSITFGIIYWYYASNIVELQCISLIIAWFIHDLPDHRHSFLFHEHHFIFFEDKRAHKLLRSGINHQEMANIYCHFGIIYWYFIRITWSLAKYLSNETPIPALQYLSAWWLLRNLLRDT